MQVKKIKVVFAVNDFVVGGTQKLLVDIFKFFDKERFDLFLMTVFQFPNKWEMYGLLPEGTRIYKFNFSNFWDMKEWIKLVRTLKNIGPHVIISNNFFSNVIFRILRLIFRYKVIIVEHNTHLFKNVIHIWLDRFLSKFTDKIVGVSKTVVSFTAQQEKIGLEKFTVIHNGIDLDEINKAKSAFDKDKILKELEFTERDKIIINVARLTPQKNHKFLIDAFKKFSEKHGNYKLIIISEGSLRNKLQEQINSLEIRDKVFLLGVKKNVYDYYLASNFFVSASIIEGFSIAYAEAMACGLPVLSTKTAGTDEMIQEGINGYFIKEGTASDILDGLEKMALSNILMMGKNAQKTIGRFSIKNTVKKYEDLILELVNEK